MLSLHDVTLVAGARTLARDITFAANAGDRIALVGPNGSGKSTLLRAIAGNEPPAAGMITRAPSLRPGYLPQDPGGAPGETAGGAYPALFGGGPAQAEFERVTAALAAEANPDRIAALSDRYGELLDALAGAGPGIDGIGGWETFGLRPVDPAEPLANLSGGERTRLALAALVADGPDLLLLDEPTNHLDVDGVRWLESWLREFPGAVVLVSHDRALLDACATAIVAIDPRDQSARVFAGGYAEYAEALAREEEAQWEAWRRQRREERKLREHISAIESRARNTENRTIHFHYRKRAAKVARRSTVLKARLERQSERGEQLDRPERRLVGPRGAFAAAGGGSPWLIEADNAVLEAGGRALLSRVRFEVHRGERVFLAGPNGSGKTTLLRAVAGRHPLAGGSLHVSASAVVGELAQDGLGTRWDGLTPIELVRTWHAMTQAEASDFLHWFFFAGEQLTTPAGRLSQGERQRLALARFFLEPTDLLLLDEPTNHLDIPAREAFEETLASFEGAVLTATHDRRFMERHADRILHIVDGSLMQQ